MRRLFATGYAPVDGMDIYWERHGSGGTPLVVVHGGFGLAGTLADLIARLVIGREVIALELQAHGHTRNIDRPFGYPVFGDDIAGVIGHLGIDRADLLGYSLGGAACLRTAIQHSECVRRLSVVSALCCRDGWFPEGREQMASLDSRMAAQMMRPTLYAAWSASSERTAFPRLMGKTADLLRAPYDWREEVGGLRLPALLVLGDADSISPAHAAEFFALLGGGLCDAGWDGAVRTQMRLAILAGRTH